jgi:hypothetical protein
MKRLETDAKQLGRARFVVLRLLESAHDHLSLDFFQGRADGQRQRIFVTQAFALFDRVRSKVVPFDLFAGTDDHRALDHVSEFTNVSGPAMKLKCLDGRGAEKPRGTPVFLSELRDKVLGE